MIALQGHRVGRPVWRVAFAPDGGRLASAGADGTVRLWDLATGGHRVLARTSCEAVAFSPCGRWLVCGSHTGLWRWGPHDETPAVVPGRPSVTRALAFSPDGSVMAAGGHVLQLIETATWKPWPGWRRRPPPCTALAFSPAGSLLASAHRRYFMEWNRRGGGGTLRSEVFLALWDWRSAAGRGRLTGPGPAYDVSALALSRDGRHLAAASGPHLWIWDVQTRRPALRRATSRHHVQSVAFSPDGLWLAVAQNDGCVRFLDTISWGEAHAFDWGIGPAVAVAFSPDGMKAAAGGKRGKIVVWDVDL